MSVPKYQIKVSKMFNKLPMTLLHLILISIETIIFETKTNELISNVIIISLHNKISHM